MYLEKEIEFILTLDQLKNVIRRNFNHDNSRRENTAEHSWQVIVFAQILFPYARNKEKIDLGRVIKMLSIHDVVEIDAGDTFFYDEKANEFTIKVKDQGDGFDWQRFREFDSKRLTDPNGRGIMISQNSGFDVVRYLGNGSEFECKIKINK